MHNMPLLLFDLDNTLLPRDAAFRAWAQDFLTEHGLPPAELDWLTAIDGGGYVPRSTVLSAARRRYGLDHSFDFLLAHYRRGINSHIHCPSRHIDALRAARVAGWTLGIVSNGGTRPQLEKIRLTGLGPLVDGWVISEEAQCLKPDPLIFEIAAKRCGVKPTGDWASDTWMIGDHAPADIAGAELTGLRSVWLHHGRPWAEPGYRPTVSAPGLPEAVGLVLAAANAPSARPGTRTGSRHAARATVPAAAIARATATGTDGSIGAPSAPGPASVRNLSGSTSRIPGGPGRVSTLVPSPSPTSVPIPAITAACCDGNGNGNGTRNSTSAAIGSGTGADRMAGPSAANPPRPRPRTRSAVPASGVAPGSAIAARSAGGSEPALPETAHPSAASSSEAVQTEARSTTPNLNSPALNTSALNTSAAAGSPQAVGSAPALHRAGLLIREAAAGYLTPGAAG